MAKRAMPDPTPELPAGRLIGYARISTAEQSLDLQLDALRKAGVATDNIHSEQVSGVAKKRPGLAKAMMDARAGDTLVVWKLDRVGRSLLDLLGKLRELETAGVGFRSLTEGIDTTTPGGRLIMHVMGSLAQFERDLIVERTRAGMRAYRERGGIVGKPATLTAEKLLEIQRALRSGETVKAIAKRYGVSKAAVYRYFDGPSISALRGRTT